MTPLRARCSACQRLRPLLELLPIDFPSGRRWYCRAIDASHRLAAAYVQADAALRQATTPPPAAVSNTSRRDTR